MTLDQLSRDELARHVGTTVRLRAPEGAELTIAGVTPSQIAGEWETFSVELCGSPDNPLRQSTYELAHDELGEMAIFLVPISRDASRARYEAVFTRARPVGGQAGG